MLEEDPAALLRPERIPGLLAKNMAGRTSTQAARRTLFPVRLDVAALEAADSTRRFELGEAPTGSALAAPIGQVDVFDASAVLAHERGELLALSVAVALGGAATAPRRRASSDTASPRERQAGEERPPCGHKRQRRTARA